MKKIGISLACLALPLLAGAAQAAADERWSVWLEQDGKKIPFQNEVHLKKKPFTLVFNGRKGLGYVLTGSVNADDLARRKTKEEVIPVVNPGIIIAEARDSSDRLLVVNNAGAIAAGESAAQSWSADEESHSSSFQQYNVDAAGMATARREIQRIQFQSSFAVRGDLPLADFPKNKIHVLINGLNEDSDLTPGPRFASIVFDPVAERELAPHSYTAATSASAGVNKGVQAYYARDYSAASIALQPYADLGDPVAEYYLGEVYAKAEFAGHDDDKAAGLLLRAKKRGVAMAADRLNVLSKEKRITPKAGAYLLKDDDKVALEALAAKADRGDIATMERLAVAYCFDALIRAGGDETALAASHPHAAEWLRKAAEGGEPRAQYQLGMHAMQGTACSGPGTKDVAQGISWMRKAAAQGLVAAQIVLASYDKEVRDGLMNPGEGLRWLKLALEQKDPRAHALMGEYLADGWNVEQNDAAMRQSLAKAIELGVGQAMEQLATSSVAHFDTRDYPTAVKMRTQAVDAGHWQSAKPLALMYEKGEGVAKNPAQAMSLLNLAAQVDPEAIYLMSVRFERGSGVAKNSGHALTLLVRAAEAGSTSALESLASKFKRGESPLPKNAAMAYVLYSLAVTNGKDDVAPARDEVGQKMTQAENQEAKSFLAGWRPGMRFGDTPLFQKLTNASAGPGANSK